MIEIMVNLPVLPDGFEYTGEYRIPEYDEYFLQPSSLEPRRNESNNITWSYLILRKTLDFPPAEIKLSDVYTKEALKLIPEKYEPIAFRIPKLQEEYLGASGMILYADVYCGAIPRIILKRKQ
jgi:intein/homing endonuclease